MADTSLGSSASAVVAHPELSINSCVVTATNLQVAQHFNKRHANVMRAIKSLLSELSSADQLNFERFTTDVPVVGAANVEGSTRSSPAYRMTREGFMLLAMGFTGKEALRWKLAYIAAFNRMEAELQKPAYDPARIQLARSQAAQAAAQVTQTVFDAIASGRNSDWRRARYMLGFAYDNSGQPSLPPRSNAGRRANGGIYGRADPAHHQPRRSPHRRTTGSLCHRLHPATHQACPVS